MDEFKSAQLKINNGLKRSFQMKKRILVLGIALVLLVLVAGVAISESSLASRTLNGVMWVLKDNTDGSLPMEKGLWLEVYNTNSYTVRVILDNTWANAGFIILAPDETKNVRAAGRSATVKNVVRERS